MSEYKQYRRTAIAEMADWHEGFDMAGVSVSDADKANGSPRPGDKIARNPKNHADRWLVAKAYFEDNFAPMDSSVALRTIAAQLAEALEEVEWPGDISAAVTGKAIVECPSCETFYGKGHRDGCQLAAALAAWKEYNRES